MNKRIPEQLEQDIASILRRMGELLHKYSIPYLMQVDYGKYGVASEFQRKWFVPQAETTYNTYIRILAQLHEEKWQKGK